MSQPKSPDAYLIDTCKIVDSGKYLPGAVVYLGRKKIETIQWKDKECDTQEQADAIVREHFLTLGIPEASNEGELRSAYA